MQIKTYKLQSLTYFGCFVLSCVAYHFLGETPYATEDYVVHSIEMQQIEDAHANLEIEEAMNGLDPNSP